MPNTLIKQYSHDERTIALVDFEVSPGTQEPKLFEQKTDVLGTAYWQALELSRVDDRQVAEHMAAALAAP